MNPLEFVANDHGEASWAGFARFADLFRGFRSTESATSPIASPSLAEGDGTSATQLLATSATAIASKLIANSTAASDPPEFMLLRLSRAIFDIATNSDIKWSESRWLLVVNYLVSKFAVLCMGMAVVLNRTAVFAHTRRLTPLDWPSRVFLRGLALSVLIYNSLPLLRALHFFVPSLRFFLPIAVPATNEKCSDPRILWGLYQAISLSNLVETFVSVIQGRIPYSETGLTLFEYSAAFQEVDMSKRLSTQILVISLISVCSQVSLHLQGLFSTERYRLMLSTVFGTALLSYFGYSVFNGELLYFPSICVIGYLPQLAIAIMVALCLFILSLTSLLGGDWQHLQSYLSTFRVDETDDFYSCLMKLSLIALTSATKATYLTETTSFNAPTNTWVEEQSSKQNYENEVTLPPASFQNEWRNIKSGPTSLVTVNRLVHAIDLARSFLWVGSAALIRSVEFMWGAARTGNATRESVTGPDVPLQGTDEGGDLRFIEFGEAVFEEEDGDEYDEDYRLVEYEGDAEVGIESDVDDDDDEYEEEYEDNGLVLAEDELLDLFKESDMAVDLLHSVIVPPHHPSRQYAGELSRGRRRSSRSIGIAPSNYSEIIDMASLIYERRREAMTAVEMRRQHGAPDPWQDTDRYLCVVCKVQPREVVVWPCRCFAICEECRVALAVKNFKGCVCCRREVNAFSRVFSP